MAIGVLLFAGDYLEGVVDSLEGRFGRSFWAGVAAQLALAPVLVLLVVALAVTILGILLIPFAIVAFVLAVAGLIAISASRSANGTCPQNSATASGVPPSPYASA